MALQPMSHFSMKLLLPMSTMESPNTNTAGTRVSAVPRSTTLSSKHRATSENAPLWLAIGWESLNGWRSLHLIRLHLSTNMTPLAFVRRC